MSAHIDDEGIDGERVDEVAQFAALLRMLKEHTDRSYGSLARRLGMNTSTLHRYCAGDTVPLDFAPVERFAALCGATPEQRLELHRKWLLAVAVRRPARPVKAAPSASDTGSEAVPDAVGGPNTAVRATPAADTASRTADSPAAGRGPAPAPPATPAPSAASPLPGRPWYRRRRLVAGLTSLCAVLATLGGFSVLPDGRRATVSSSEGVTATKEAGAPARQSASSGPSDILTTGQPSGTPAPGSVRPSGSASPQQQPGAVRPPGARSAPPPRGEQPVGPPLAWSVNSHAWKLGCGHSYVIAKPPHLVPPPPAPQDAAPWAATQSAVHGGETLVQLSVQGRDDTAVVLEALRVRVVGRTAPAQGNAYSMGLGCGGAVTPRYLAVDLDKDRPIARAVAGNDTGTPVPAVRMPYRVSAKDPEVLLITARTRSCDCRWYLELDWSSQGRTGTVRIDDNGRPFRTSAIEGLPQYAYDPLGRRWGNHS